MNKFIVPPLCKIVYQYKNLAKMANYIPPYPNGSIIKNKTKPTTSSSISDSEFEEMFI